MSLQTILQHYFERALPPDYQPTINLEVSTHDPNRDTSKFRVSDAGKCRLMRYWKRQGKTGNSYNGNKLLLEAGNLFHAYIQHICAEMKVLNLAEFQLEDMHRIGHIDMLIKEGESLVLYELKTVSEKQFYYKTKNHVPDRQHRLQILSYARMFHDLYPFQDMPKMSVAYLNRDTLSFLELEVTYTGYAEEMTDDWDQLIDAWLTGQEPKPTNEEWECNYCLYKDDCGERP